MDVKKISKAINSVNKFNRALRSVQQLIVDNQPKPKHDKKS